MTGGEEEGLGCPLVPLARIVEEGSLLWDLINREEGPDLERLGREQVPIHSHLHVPNEGRNWQMGLAVRLLSDALDRFDFPI